MAGDKRPPKTIKHGDDSLQAVYNGIRKCAQVVGYTMGPKGRNVLIDKGAFNSPTSTKDGVTVLREVLLEDPVEDYGSRVLKQAADSTVEEAGDGTTATVIIAEALLREGIKRITAGSNVIKVNDGIQKALRQVNEFLTVFKEDVTTLDEIKHVATVSSQNEDVGSMIAFGMKEIGEFGTITVETVPGSVGLFWDLVQGMHFDTGLFSQDFFTDEAAGEYDAKNVAVALINDLVRSPFELKPLIDAIMAKGMRNILIIGEITGEALTTLKANRKLGALFPCVIRPPAYGSDQQFHIMQDIAVATGGQVFSYAAGNPLPKAGKEFDFKNIGIAQNVKADTRSLKIIDGCGLQEEIAKRQDYLKGLIEKAPDEFARHKLRERLARFAGGIGRIRVGGSTEVQAEELRFRVDDAVSAARSAAEEGIVPGGGVALLRAYHHLSRLGAKGYQGDEKIGRDILMSALKRPAWQIAHISGESGDVIVNGILEREKNEGFNFASGEYEDMMKAGIIDPKKVVRLALENAVSVAVTILNSGASITDMLPS